MCKLCDGTLFSFLGYLTTTELIVCSEVTILPNNLNGLISLNVSNNKNITYIPSSLVDLEHINISCTNITYLPHELTKLKSIKASYSKLLSIGPFYQLEYLDVSACQKLDHLSDKLVLLKNLNISLTRIESLHSSYTQLETLNCSESSIVIIPDTYTSLEELICSHTNITTLPNTFLHLIILNCSGTNIKNIPGTYLYLKKLEWITNITPTLPDTLINLEELNISTSSSLSSPSSDSNEVVIPETLIKLKNIICEGRHTSDSDNGIV